MKAIFAVMDTTLAVVTIRPEKNIKKNSFHCRPFFFSFSLALIFTTAQLVFITAKIAFIFTISALFESCSQILRKRSGVYTLCTCLYLV